jgi:toxin ParE1/3/4
VLSLLIKPKAEKDLEEIFEFTFYKWGFSQAEKYQDELFQGMQQICSQNEIGKLYKYTNKHYRYYHVNRHLIFYRVEEKACIIVRIIHDSMLVENHL